MQIGTAKELETLAARRAEDLRRYRSMLMVCTSTGCVSAKSFDVRDALQKELRKRGLEGECLVVSTGCMGFCAVGPIVIVQPAGVFYQRVGEGDVADIVEKSVVQGAAHEKLLYRDPGTDVVHTTMDDIGFFSKQQLVAFRNKGLVDPENIEDYIARGGYGALARVLASVGPERVVEEVLASGIRGRGGAGFPTGLKWRSCREVAARRGEKPYVVCNADEGDPGAFMDRSLIETDPHSIIEGMLIGAWAVGAEEGFVYVRKEYPLAMARLRKAIDQARERGLLGKAILGSSLSFDIRVHRGAGAFVCGESTALMASMSGRVGEPRAKYVHNVEAGFRDRPTVLNNVETWATIPVIIEKGADWFAAIGTGRKGDPWGGSSGTKTFSLVGNINNTGLIEVPMGITLREIIFDIGGGIPGGRTFKAVQTGGPSGGCIPASMLDLRVDFDSLAEAGSMMGSGGMIVMDERTCMVDVARYFVSFLVDESCGKCTPCREGLAAMSGILTRICGGEGREGDLELLEELCGTIGETSLCQLGATAVNPVMSTLRHFREEYEEHIREKRCRAGACKALVTYRILEDRCTGCLACLKPCPAHAITGERKKVHVIDSSLCIKCGICFEACTYDAVEVK
jgi:NADH:ubiquinone oxidoreductase subunit F (NADH-binding)/(2Fe-2S) ferredoxin/NAD-dependent dihydropyrimidine dehydrogenase PreA subunit